MTSTRDKKRRNLKFEIKLKPATETIEMAFYQSSKGVKYQSIRGYLSSRVIETISSVNTAYAAITLCNRASYSGNGRSISTSKEVNTQRWSSRGSSRGDIIQKSGEINVARGYCWERSSSYGCCEKGGKLKTRELYPHAEHAEILNTRKTIIDGSTWLRFWSPLSTSRMNSLRR